MRRNHISTDLLPDGLRVETYELPGDREEHELWQGKRLLGARADGWTWTRIKRLAMEQVADIAPERIGSPGMGKLVGALVCAAVMAGSGATYAQGPAGRPPAGTRVPTKDEFDGATWDEQKAYWMDQAAADKWGGTAKSTLVPMFVMEEVGVAALLSVGIWGLLSFESTGEDAIEHSERLGAAPRNCDTLTCDVVRSELEFRDTQLMLGIFGVAAGAVSQGLIAWQFAALTANEADIREIKVKITGNGFSISGAF